MSINDYDADGPVDGSHPAAAITAEEITAKTKRYIRKQRVRVNKCGVKLRIPAVGGRAEAVFTCTLERDDAMPHDTHEEEGIVHMADGSYRTYAISWNDLGILVTRKRSTKTASDA